MRRQFENNKNLYFNEKRLFSDAGIDSIICTMSEYFDIIIEITIIL